MEVESYNTHQAIIALLTEYIADVLVLKTISSQHFIRMTKKELNMTYVPQPMVPDASSNTGLIIDTTNWPTPDQVEAEEANFKQDE